jgi:hypothetical protein
VNSGGSEGRTPACLPCRLRRRRCGDGARTLLGGSLPVAGAAGVGWWRSRAATAPRSCDPVAHFENHRRSVADRSVTVADHPTAHAHRVACGCALATGAGLVVSGIYTLAGEEISIQTRLTDARSGQFQALDPAVGPLGAPMTAVEAARQRVMGAVAVRVDPNWVGAPDESPPTYDAYQEVRVSQEGGVDSISHLRRAVESDRFRAGTHAAHWLVVRVQGLPEAARRRDPGRTKGTTHSPPAAVPGRLRAWLASRRRGLPRRARGGSSSRTTPALRGSSPGSHRTRTDSTKRSQP